MKKPLWNPFQFLRTPSPERLLKNQLEELKREYVATMLRMEHAEGEIGVQTAQVASYKASCDALLVSIKRIQAYEDTGIFAATKTK